VKKLYERRDGALLMDARRGKKVSDSAEWNADQGASVTARKGRVSREKERGEKELEALGIRKKRSRITTHCRGSTPQL